MFTKGLIPFAIIAIIPFTKTLIHNGQNEESFFFFFFYFTSDIF